MKEADKKLVDSVMSLIDNLPARVHLEVINRSMYRKPYNYILTKRAIKRSSNENIFKTLVPILPHYHSNGWDKEFQGELNLRNYDPELNKNYYVISEMYIKAICSACGCHLTSDQLIEWMAQLGYTQYNSHHRLWFKETTNKLDKNDRQILIDKDNTSCLILGIKKHDL